ncbi:MAG: DNA polymerase III subunit delta [Patescibacteria group bacterium]
MIVFLYGKDAYRVKQNADRIVKEYLAKNPNGMGVLRVDLAEGEEKFEKFENAVKTASFFNEKKLIVVKNVFSQAEKILRDIKKYDLVGDKETILAVCENASQAEMAKTSKKLLAQLTAKPSVAKAFNPLAGKQLENWIAKETKTLGLEIEPPAIKQLVLYAGDDVWRLSQEIIKLANHSFGYDRRLIKTADVELLVTKPASQNIFETIDALGRRDKGKAITLLSRHLAAGDDPHYLFSMFVYQFRNLLRVKDIAAAAGPGGAAAIAQKTGLHPFAVKKMLEQSRQFELGELKRKFSRLAEADIQIKNGLIDITDLLYQIALS